MWIPDENYKFPISNSNRRFQHAWLQAFRPWLCYSKLHDGAFCINCAMFYHNAQFFGKVERLCTVPYKNWKNAMQDFKVHRDKSPWHRNAAEDTYKFRQTITGNLPGINRQLNSVMTQQINKNREILKCLIKILITVTQQCIPLRGRNECNPTEQYRSDLTSSVVVQNDKNPGNFLALVKLAVELQCPILKEHLSKCAKNATYLSKTVQNEMLSLIANNIVEQVVGEIKKSKYFSVLADEAVDISNKEQMPIIIRYVDGNCEIRETFLKMAECKLGCSGKGLSKTILKSVNDIKLDMHNCRGQVYDGAGFI